MREKPPSVRRGGEEGEDKKEAEGKEECGRGAAQLDPASTDEGNAEDGGESEIYKSRETLLCTR